MSWCVSTLQKLPSLESEANWPENIEIPPLFNFQQPTVDSESSTGSFFGVDTSQDSLESCGFEVSESTPVSCDENLFDMISSPTGQMSELEDIADTSIPTID